MVALLLTIVCILMKLNIARCKPSPLNNEIEGLWEKGIDENFKIRTYTACSTHGFAYISGHQKQRISHDQCKMECLKHRWCRGIRISGSISNHFGKCRLLTNHKIPLPGWIFYNEGNWVEPSKWKETGDVTCKTAYMDNTYHCYEKVSCRKF